MELQENILISGELFEAVQKSKVFPDCKTFVDCVPKINPKEILKKYHQEKNHLSFDLSHFIDQYFNFPKQADHFITNEHHSMEKHIESLWPVLSSDPDLNKSPYSSLIPLPYPYIVPGGRFREIYYWDSYFTSEGLVRSGHIDLVENMANNFAYLIEKIGHIPNGNRIYYLSRSQPPFLNCMLDILEREKGFIILHNYIPALEKEYEFWMDGKNNLSKNNAHYRRVILTENNIILNRYWDDLPAPRPESYREDVDLYQQTPKQYQFNLYLNIRATCESGWDFSSRWFRDQKNIETVYTTEIIPIDLNCLLYHTEEKLFNYYSVMNNFEKIKKYQSALEKRKQGIQEILWNEKENFYHDYHWTEKKSTSTKSLAAVYPLFFKICTQSQADAIANTLEKFFLYDGGLITTLTVTSQQWDKPNGWAPLHWLAVNGLLNYGHEKLAKEITKRWLTLNENVFNRTGKMVEKYNVCDTSLKAGGGEYLLQDGFGWTNGIAIALKKLFS